MLFPFPNYQKIDFPVRNGSFQIGFAVNATRITYVLLLTSLRTLHPVDLCSRESSNRESLNIAPRENEQPKQLLLTTLLFRL